jgi:hypothetical protein
MCRPSRRWRMCTSTLFGSRPTCPRSSQMVHSSRCRGPGATSPAPDWQTRVRRAALRLSDLRRLCSANLSRREWEPPVMAIGPTARRKACSCSARGKKCHGCTASWCITWPVPRHASFALDLPASHNGRRNLNLLSSGMWRCNVREGAAAASRPTHLSQRT